jgi:hypothetical protein
MTITAFANDIFVPLIASDAHCGDGQSNDPRFLGWNSRDHDPVADRGGLASLAAFALRDSVEFQSLPICRYL